MADGIASTEHAAPAVSETQVGSAPASLPEPKASSPNYLPTLDGWRALAILLVMFHHSAHAMRNALGDSVAAISELLIQHGQMGVHIFFGISGFLICSRLLKENDENGRISLQHFYLRRAFRILPPLLLFLITAGLLGQAGVIPLNRGQWFASLFFYANYYTGGNWYLAHFWSLAIEEHFYLFWPAILVLAGARRGLWIAIALAVAVGAWRGLDLLYNLTPPSFPSVWGRTDSQLDGLLWGCVLAILYMQASWRAYLEKRLSGLITLVLLAVLIGLVLIQWPWYRVMLVMLMVQAIIIPVLLVGTILHPETMLGRVLEFPPLRWIGRLSYSLYLWQQLFLVWDDARSPHMGWLQRFPLNLVCAFLCATACYYCVEKPLVKVGHRLVGGKKRSAAA